MADLKSERNGDKSDEEDGRKVALPEQTFPLLSYKGLVCDIVLVCSDMVLVCDDIVLVCSDIVLVCSDMVLVCDDIVLVCSDIVLVCSDMQVRDPP